MDLSVLLQVGATALAVLVPLAGFAVRLDRRLTRVETLLEDRPAQSDRRSAANIASFRSSRP